MLRQSFQSFDTKLKLFCCILISTQEFFHEIQALLFHIQGVCMGKTIFQEFSRTLLFFKEYSGLCEPCLPVVYFKPQSMN